MTTPLPAALTTKPLVVVDVEGNGQQPPEIIEIATLVVGDSTGSERLKSWLVRPVQPITSFVTQRVHGIRNQDVEDAPRWADVARDIEAALVDRTLVAHNASVEYRVISQHLPNWRPPLVLDTMRLAKHAWPGLPDGYGMDALITAGKVDTNGVAEQQRHRAEYDTWCAWKLLLALIHDTGIDWASLVDLAALPAFRTKPPDHEGLW